MKSFDSWDFSSSEIMIRSSFNFLEILGRIKKNTSVG
jgi:hypothetical protein